MSNKCSVCGASVKEGDLFCLQCGTRLEVHQESPRQDPPGGKICEKCGAQNNEGDIFCLQCGARLEVHQDPPRQAQPAQEPEQRPGLCANCGEQNDEDDLFCKNCGQRLPVFNTESHQPKYPNSNNWYVPTSHEPQSDAQSRADDTSFAGTLRYILFFIFILVLLGFVFTRSSSRSTSSSSYSQTVPQQRETPTQRETPAPRPSAPRPAPPRPSTTESERRAETPAPSVMENSARQDHGPARYQYISCSGSVVVRTNDGSLLNVRPSPGVRDKFLFQVPNKSKLRVDGWAWDIETGGTYWFRVVDYGGHVLGWVSRDYCNESDVDFRGTRPYASNWKTTTTHTGSSAPRKYDPESFSADWASGYITVSAGGSYLNVRPAPGEVDDVVFALADKSTCKVSGWSHDRFGRGTGRTWFRLTDNHSNVLGWVDARFCKTQRVYR